jgi:hypothetical protein
MSVSKDEESKKYSIQWIWKLFNSF